MRTVFFFICLTFISASINANPFSAPKGLIPTKYNNKYCYATKELQRWQKILDENQHSDDVQALHALWLGLCQKVENRKLTVIRANVILKKARTGVTITFPKKKNMFCD